MSRVELERDLAEATARLRSWARRYIDGAATPGDLECARLDVQACKAKLDAAKAKAKEAA